jgi:hypothetical protein
VVDKTRELEHQLKPSTAHGCTKLEVIAEADADGANAAGRHVAEHIRCLDANVPEPLALEACCLEITRKA